MKERRLVSALRHPWPVLLGVIALFCLLAVSACGAIGGTTQSETVHIYDSARVLNTAAVQKAARNVPAQVDVYTMRGFTGTQADFQRAMADKVRRSPGRVVVGIDPQNHYQFIARGSDVPLSTFDIATATGAFDANYGNANYTRATIAQLNSLGNAMRANGATSTNRSSSSPLPWLVPLLILGAVLFALAQVRRPPSRASMLGKVPYRPRQPEGQPLGQNPPPFPTIDQATYQRERGFRERELGEQGRSTGRSSMPEKGKSSLAASGPTAAPGTPFGYELEKHPGEAKPERSGGAGISEQNSNKKTSGPEQGNKGVSEKRKPDLSSDIVRHFGQRDGESKPGMKPLGEKIEESKPGDVGRMKPLGSKDGESKPSDVEGVKHFGQRDGGGAKPQGAKVEESKPSDVGGMKPQGAKIEESKPSDVEGVKPQGAKIEESKPSDVGGMKPQGAKVEESKPSDVGGMKPQGAKVEESKPGDVEGAKPQGAKIEESKPEMKPFGLERDETKPSDIEDSRRIGLGPRNIDYDPHKIIREGRIGPNLIDDSFNKPNRSSEPRKPGRGERPDPGGPNEPDKSSRGGPDRRR